MVVQVNQQFGIGTYWLACGYRAEVVQVMEDGTLLGRYDCQTNPDSRPCWLPGMWCADGRYTSDMETHRLVMQKPTRIKADYWVNVYPSGPGQLRKSWEEALIEASRCEEDVLCRVRVPINAEVGEGLR